MKKTIILLLFTTLCHFARSQSSYTPSFDFSSDTLEEGESGNVFNTSSGDLSDLSFVWEYPVFIFSDGEPVLSTETSNSSTLNFAYSISGTYEFKMHVYKNSVFQQTVTKNLFVKSSQLAISCQATQPVCELVCNFNAETANSNVGTVYGMGQLYAASGYANFSRQTGVFSSSSCGSIVTVPNPEYFSANNAWSLGNGTQTNSCYPNTNTISVTANFAGTQASHNGGNSYLGIRTYVHDPVAFYNANSSSSTFRIDTREYITGSLTSPLVAGQTYYISFWVSLADYCNYASNKIGLKFMTYNGPGAPSSDNSGFRYNYANLVTESCSPLLFPELITELVQDNGTAITPDIVSNSIITDKTDWVQITGSFVSPAGGENWFVIGNFSNDANTSSQALSNGLPCMNTQAYYYIDDISISATPNYINVTASPNPICPGQSVTLTATPLVNGTYSWSTGQSGVGLNSISVTPTTSTTYTVTLNTSCPLDPPASVMELLPLSGQII